MFSLNVAVVCVVDVCAPSQTPKNEDAQKEHTHKKKNYRVWVLLFNVYDDEHTFCVRFECCSNVRMYYITFEKDYEPWVSKAH